MLTALYPAVCAPSVRAGDFPAIVELSLLDGASGFAFAGPTGSYAGRSVGALGDVNDDGFDDIIIGAPLREEGVSYIVFGKASGFPAELRADELDGKTGFVLKGVSVGGQ